MWLMRGYCGGIKYFDLPENVCEIVDCQTNIILVIRDANVLLEADDLCVPDISAVQKGEKKEYC